MSQGSDTRPGIWASLKRIVDTLLATAQHRIELLAVEWQEEKCRLMEALLCAVALAVFSIMTLTLATFLLVVVFWENGRLFALGGLIVLYLSGAMLAWRALQTRMKARSAFAGTLDELKKDRECLSTNN
jgi:uncharacterized membrane protein YqjE